MEKMKLKNGKEINLEIKYGKLFEFQRKYKDIARSDLVSLITEKEVLRKTATIEHESIMQLIYVAYLGGGNEEPIIEYDDFINNELNFDFKRDLKLFAKLTGNNDEKN